MPEIVKQRVVILIGTVRFMKILNSNTEVFKCDATKEVKEKQPKNWKVNI